MNKNYPYFLMGCLCLNMVACASSNDPNSRSQTINEIISQAAEPVSEFTVQSGSITISCDLHRVADSDPDHVMLVQGGSGAHLRSDLKQAVPMFLSEGLAVSICDRRGAGASTGSLETPSTLNSKWQIPLFADDAAATAEELHDMGFHRIGITGSSMGGWVSVAAAARTELIDYAITINGGASSVALSDAFDTLTDQGLNIQAATHQLRTETLVDSYSPDLDIKRLHQPILWILSGEDSSNPTELDLEAITRWKNLGKRFETIVVKGVDHNFVNLQTGQPELSWLAEAKTFAAKERPM